MTSTRTEFIAALRDLADFLVANPAIPVPPYTEYIRIFPDGASDAERRAGVDRLAALLDTTPADKNGHYIAIRRFGPLLYEAIAISDAARDAHNAEMSYSGGVTPDTTEAGDISEAA